MAERPKSTPLRLGAHREAARLSVAELATAANVSRTTIYRLESGITTGIDFGVLVALARVLGVQPGDLFAPPESAPPPAPRPKPRKRSA